uniref:Uncharacterized protein n=1 Tax=Octopus bimaculoides TaxID=37653 RepID=A0A0L8FYW8_OCTBM
METNEYKHCRFMSLPYSVLGESMSPLETNWDLLHEPVLSKENYSLIRPLQIYQIGCTYQNLPNEMTRIRKNDASYFI